MPDLELEDDPFHDQEGTHSVHAHYRYKVRGRWYFSRRLSYRSTAWIRFRDALDMIDGMKPGKEVDVFLRPAQARSRRAHPGQLDHQHRLPGPVPRRRRDPGVHLVALMRAPGTILPQ
jgi:hypothetical protein